MRKTALAMVFALIVVFGMTHVAQAGPQEEAKALALKAAVFWKANGKEKTAAEINNPNGQFRNGDLYVFAMDFNGVHIANGGNPKLVGMNHLELKDSNGIFLTKEMIAIAKTKGSGWVNYSWVNPSTKKIQAKTTFVTRVEDTNYYVACGVWK